MAEDGSEHSVERVDAFHVPTGQYSQRRPMPIPVDDAVALVYQRRYIYMVSGWHDLGNVNLVQVYDTAEDTWTQATPYPGVPVFGHAGGLVGNTMVIADGVGIEVSTSGRRRFVMVGDAYIGRIDDKNIRRIAWHRLPPHPGKARYRMAATGWAAADGDMVVFAGGSERAYNYNGIGYDGIAAEASDEVFGYRIASGRWHRLGRLPVATMDHRGLLTISGAQVANAQGAGATAAEAHASDHGTIDFVIVGGMRDDQAVSAEVITFRLPAGP